MKYFFLADSWTTGRIWEFGGLWNERARRRRPNIQKQTLCIQENGDTLRLYAVEEAVLMIEVLPIEAGQSTIGQVVLKRLLTAEQVIEKLCQEKTIFQAADLSTDTNDQASSISSLPVP